MQEERRRENLLKKREEERMWHGKTNKGQDNEKIKFISRSAGFNLFRKRGEKLNQEVKKTDNKKKRKGTMEIKEDFFTRLFAKN